MIIPYTSNYISQSEINITFRYNLYLNISYLNNIIVSNVII